ncbi:MAG: hypothetical protein ACLSAP_13020 [Oscillospiraceae bacterium]
MRKILKWIAALVSVVTLIGGVALVVLAVRGYLEFQDAADAKPLAQAVEEIQKRPEYVPLERISEDFRNAIVAVEDHRFRAPRRGLFLAGACAVYQYQGGPHCGGRQHYHTAVGEKSLF